MCHRLHKKHRYERVWGHQWVRYWRGQLWLHESGVLKHNRVVQMFGHSRQRAHQPLRGRLQISSTDWPMRRYVSRWAEHFCFHFPTQQFLFRLPFIYFSLFLPFFSHKQINDSILLDINECSEGTDDCNRKTQLCLNTRGSYKCQEKIGDKCLLGLKYNSETKLCEGGYCLIYSQALSNA